MNELVIENGIMIDDADGVLWSVRELSGKTISGIEVIKRFIDQEKNSVFYLDKNLNSYLQKQPDSLYAWLDTGFTDRFGNPILISLLKGTDGYAGHIVGTVAMLSENVRNYFRLNRTAVQKKVDAFRKKYALKSEERNIRHILSEQSYLTDCIHKFDGITEISLKIQNLGLSFVENSDEENKEAAYEIEEKIEAKPPEFTRFEEEITIGILLERMESFLYNSKCRQHVSQT